MSLRTLVVAACLFGVSILPAGAQVVTFPGICNASAAVALDERRIVVGDDEEPWLSVYDLDGHLVPPTLPFLVAAAGDAAAQDSGEADIEAATLFKGQIVWMSSFGRDRKGEVSPGRFQFFASHRLDRQTGSATVEFSPSYHDLLPLILASRDPAYAAMAAAIGDLSRKQKRLAPKREGFNVEGLTATGDGEALLVGLRNPLAAGRAILFELDGMEAVLDGSAPAPRLGTVKTLDLGGRGIRDIAWSPAHDAYLVLAGQADDTDAGPGFALFKWDGKGALAPVAGPDWAAMDFHPEAVVPLLDRSGATLVPSKRVLVLSDDGTMPGGEGRRCKKGQEPRQFRGVVRHVE